MATSLLAFSLLLVFMCVAYGLPTKHTLNRIVKDIEGNNESFSNQPEVTELPEVTASAGVQTTERHLSRNLRSISNVGFCPEHMIWFGRKCVDFETYERLLHEYEDEW